MLLQSPGVGFGASVGLGFRGGLEFWVASSGAHAPRLLTVSETTSKKWTISQFLAALSLFTHAISGFIHTIND